MIAALISNLSSTLIFIGFLSVLIVVHEWGHFITAKRLGIKVQRFALGFGPALFSKEYNGTVYSINLIPLGGYVKMAGDERAVCEGGSDEFYSKPIGFRSLVVLNGPVVNFILAYVSFVIVFLIGYPGPSTTIRGLAAAGPAQVAGLEVGDHIVAVDGRGIYGQLNLEKRLEGSDPTAIDVTVVRDGQRLTKQVQPVIKNEANVLGRKRPVRDLGIDFLPSVIGGFSEGSAAEAAGLQAGDQILEIDGKKISGWAEVKSSVTASTVDQVAVKAARQDQILTFAVTPQLTKYRDPKGEIVEARKIGIAPEQQLNSYRFGVLNAVLLAGEELFFITQLTYESLYRMVTGALSARETMTGPVGIFFIVKGAAESGIQHLLLILGVISASLAIFNLLPIIPLDGGHLFLFAVEKLRGRPFSAKIDEYIARAGFGLILLLAVFVFYNDFSRFGWIDQFSGWLGHARDFFSRGKP